MQPLDGKKILIVKRQDNDFEAFYSDEMKKRGADVIEPTDLRPIVPNQRIKNIFNDLKAMIFGVRCVNLKSYDLIISFEDVRGIPILWYGKRKDARLILWNWNILSPKSAARENQMASFCEIWTFDPGDAATYGWKLNHDFYLPYKGKTVVTPKQDGIQTAFCVSADKGRYNLIKKIRNELTQNGVHCDFWVVKDGSSVYAPEDSVWLYEKGLPYQDVLKKTWESNIVVDVVQSAQEGITVRALEALYYGKKLITTHKRIASSLLYDSRNVFIVGKDDWSKLKPFLAQKQVPIKQEALEKYSFEDWLKRFSEVQTVNQ